MNVLRTGGVGAAEVQLLDLPGPRHGRQYLEGSLPIVLDLGDYESPATVWEAKFISFFERIFRSAVDEIFHIFKSNFLFFL